MKTKKEMGIDFNTDIDGFILHYPLADVNDVFVWMWELDLNIYSQRPNFLKEKSPKLYKILRKWMKGGK